ncbi:ABC transporter permease [Streptomyces sp. NBC_00239]|uniref:ABC transporter permease n=1 Tax=Streptomyces sp. NBC_00239 TaxID=2903640 RepID=UPI003FA7E526
MSVPTAPAPPRPGPAATGPAATAPAARVPTAAELAARPVSAEAARLAAAHGLRVSGARPSLAEYTRQLWGRRQFITAFASARMTATYSTARLGQVWHLMTPLLNAAVYYFIFGVVLNQSRHTPQFIPYLVIGVFTWDFFSSALNSGTRAVSGNLGLVRALQFPRASLPISTVVQLFQQLMVTMAALLLILLAFGQRPRASWLLALPALFLLAVFCAGCAMAMARVGSRIPDITQLMPFVLRTWMYFSGVMWNIGYTLQSQHLPQVVTTAFQWNPAALFIDLMRFALLDSFHRGQLPHHAWPLAAAWALLACVGGYVYFWKAEEVYGRG